MEVIWSNIAKSDLREIYLYYSQFSENIANKLLNKIIEQISLLEVSGFENAGQIDEFNKNFRRLIVGNYKIFYKVFTKEILIVRIFNSSQNPKLIKKNIIESNKLGLQKSPLTSK